LIDERKRLRLQERMTHPFIHTLAGNADKPNEDRAGSVGNILWVIDSATGLGEQPSYIGKNGETDAAWLAQRLHDFFLQNAAAFGFDHAGLIQTAHAALKKEFNDNKHTTPEADYAFPSAGLTLLTFDAKTIKISALGDCTTLLRHTNGTITKQSGDPVQIENDTRATAELVQLRQSLPESEHHKMRHLILPSLRKNRGMANQTGGFGSFTIARDIPSDFIRSFDVAAPDIQDLAIMSDGFYAVVEDYHALDDIGLMNSLSQNEAEQIGQKIRAIEGQDPLGHKFPRLKKSDDATVLYLRLNA
jgi:hypothetical protein